VTPLSPQRWPLYPPRVPQLMSPSQAAPVARWPRGGGGTGNIEGATGDIEEGGDRDAGPLAQPWLMFDPGLGGLPAGLGTRVSGGCPQSISAPRMDRGTVWGQREGFGDRGMAVGTDGQRGAGGGGCWGARMEDDRMGGQQDGQRDRQRYSKGRTEGRAGGQRDTGGAGGWTGGAGWVKGPTSG